jgi:hypothetical protein
MSLGQVGLLFQCIFRHILSFSFIRFELNRAKLPRMSEFSPIGGCAQSATQLTTVLPTGQEKVKIYQNNVVFIGLYS